MNEPNFTKQQEIANTATHVAGVLFCAVGVPWLIAHAMARSNANMVWAVSVFGLGMVMVYLSSTLYHAIAHKKTKRVLRMWDHISIFFLIAGSYTPFVVKYTGHQTAAVFLSVMWGIAALGTVKKVFFTGRYEALSVGLYLGMGWMAVFILKPLLANVPAFIFYWMLAGGLFYTVGIIFYVWKRFRYHHAIWHVFVLGGTVSHYFAVFFSVPLHIKV